MTNQPNSIFPIKFSYNSKCFETKALRCAGKREILYKIALPSAVSTVQQCWISNKGEQWKVLIGAESNKTLMLELITAIKRHESAIPFFSEKVKLPILKSA